jgi:hypothetical protein
VLALEADLHFGQACGCAARSGSLGVQKEAQALGHAVVNFLEGSRGADGVFGRLIEDGYLGDVPRAKAHANPLWGSLASVGKLHQEKAHLAGSGRRQMSPCTPSFINIDQSTIPVAIVSAD